MEYDFIQPLARAGTQTCVSSFILMPLRDQLKTCITSYKDNGLGVLSKKYLKGQIISYFLLLLAV